MSAEPRRITPRTPGLPTRGGHVAAIGQRMGYPLMPWQRRVADIACEYDPATGLYVHPTVRLLIPRQAGKTRLLSPLMTLASLMRRDARVWLTAQTQRDAAEWFRLEHVPAVRVAFTPRTFVARWSTGNEHMMWRTGPGLGSVIRCFAPQRDALHGKQSDFVAVDEAWSFDSQRGEDLLQAIGPTQATRPGAQVVMLSAAGDIASTWLIDQLRAARAAQDDGDHTDVLVEYGVPDDLDDEEASDVDAVAAHHPAVGITIDAGYLQAERRRLGAAGFARAYGCRQIIPDPDAVSAGAWPREVWRDVQTTDPIPEDDRIAFGIELAADRRSAAIVAASSSGLIELVDFRAGVAWVTDRAKELIHKHYARVAIDTSGPAATVADALTRASLKRSLILLGGTDAATATGLLSDAVTDPLSELPARFRPHPDMDAAVRGAVPRRVGDRYVWDRRDPDGPPVAPLIAAGLAWWGITRSAGTPAVASGRRR